MEMLWELNELMSVKLQHKAYLAHGWYLILWASICYLSSILREEVLLLPGYTGQKTPGRLVELSSVPCLPMRLCYISSFFSICFFPSFSPRPSPVVLVPRDCTLIWTATPSRWPWPGTCNFKGDQRNPKFFQVQRSDSEGDISVWSTRKGYWAA